MKQTLRQTLRQLGITRAQDELAEITSLGAESGIRILPLPLFRYLSVEFQLPAAELAVIDWLCFTSARGVERFFRALREQRMTLSDRTRFAVVGAKTATALKAWGIAPNLQPQTADSETLFNELLEQLFSNETVVYISAEDVGFDPADFFVPTNVRYRRLIVYRAEQETLSPKIVRRFSADDSILFTSPKTVRRFAELFGVPMTNLMALGESTAQAIAELGWKKPKTLPEPNVLIALEYCQRRHAQGA